MKLFLTSLLFAGLLSMVSCNVSPDMDCLKEKIKQCTLPEKVSDPEIYCISAVDALSNCITSTLKACGGVSSDFVAPLVINLKAFCRSGSELVQKFQAVLQNQCLGEMLLSLDETCVADLEAELKKTVISSTQQMTPEEINKMMKPICELTPKAVNCLYGKAEEKCTKDGRDALSALVDPMMKVLQDACSKLPGGSSAISAFSWIVLVSTALLLVIWH